MSIKYNSSQKYGTESYLTEIAANKVNQPDILFASALKMTGYLRRYSLELF